MPSILHSNTRYLRAPTLVSEKSGPVLYAIAWENDREALIRYDLDREGEPAAAKTIKKRAAIAGLTRTRARPQPTDDPAEVDRDASGAWRVRIDRDRGASMVIARTPGGRDIRVWSACATAAAPAIAIAKGGVWIAFHHNLREDTLEADLAKWIAIRFVTHDGSVLEPSAEMIDRDRDREGEEQSFEFPSLAVGTDGSLAIYGRGSHSFWRQDLSAGGFSARRALGAGEWGCRGRWVSVCAREDGTILTARREKKGIEIAIDPAPAGGMPALVPAKVDLEARAHRSIPARPDRSRDPAAEEGRRTLFGDIHQHSAHSDGIGSADEPYLRARWFYGDDFGALTDHESFIGKRIGPGEWAYLTRVADRHEERGVFATLHAYEWTGRMFPGPGHKVVYLPAGGGPIVGRDAVPEGTDIVSAVKALGGFAVPHHVGWTGANEEAHDPIGQPVWEICSCHGCYLHAEHPLGGRGDLRDQMVEEVLKRGRRFGFIACSDGHGLLFHHGVGRKRDPFRCGLTAVQAKSNTREAILEAIRERRCYATSGVPIYLDLRAGMFPMGSEIAIEGTIETRARAICATPIDHLSLIGRDGPIASISGEGELSSEISAHVGKGWVYAKVVQVDGEMAWSSPIFID
jgi:hypothetical protein